MSIKHTKPAIAMIELIFALVIMGIVLLSAPMLIHQSMQSGNVAMQQESISAGAAHTGVLLSMHWDEANANLAIGTSPILDTNRTVTPDPLDFNGGDLGGLKGVSGRISLVGGVTAYTPTTSFGPEINGSIDNNETDFTLYDDIDDYQDSHLGITVYNTQNSSADIGDYVDVNLDIHTIVSYVEDRPSSNTLSTNINVGGVLSNTIAVPTNIKFIQVNVTSTGGFKELEKNISIRAFSCNIGTFVPQGDTEL